MEYNFNAWEFQKRDLNRYNFDHSVLLLAKKNVYLIVLAADVAVVYIHCRSSEALFRWKKLSFHLFVKKQDFVCTLHHCINRFHTGLFLL